MNIKMPLLSSLALVLLSITSFQTMSEENTVLSFATQDSQLSWKSTAGGRYVSCITIYGG